MSIQNLLRKPICEITEDEFDSLPGYGAARILNQLAGEVILDVAKYGKNKIIVFIYDDGVSEFWQPYFVQFVEKQPLESAVAVDFNSSAPQMGTVSLRG